MFSSQLHKPPGGVELYVPLRDSFHNSLVICLNLFAHKLCQCMWYLSHEGLKSCISPQDSSPPINMHKPFQAKMKMKQKTTTKRRALLSFLSDACNWRKWVWVWLQCRRSEFDPWSGDPLEEGMVTHSSIFPKEPGGLESQRVELLNWKFSCSPCSIKH